MLQRRRLVSHTNAYLQTVRQLLLQVFLRTSHQGTRLVLQLQVVGVTDKFADALRCIGNA